MMQLHPNEQLLTAERRHWLPIAIESASLLIAALLPLSLLVGAELMPAGAVATVNEYRSFAWFLYAVWLLGLWMVFSISITNYYLDILLITNRRVVDIEQLGLFSRDVAELHLENIVDIHVEIKGFVASFFNYGNLYLQTSSERPQFSMNNVQDPHRVQEMISKARLAAIKEASANVPSEQKI